MKSVISGKESRWVLRLPDKSDNLKSKEKGVTEDTAIQK